MSNPTNLSLRAKIEWIIKELRRLRALIASSGGSSGGDSIPLAGTTLGNPVTGDIEVSQTFDIYSTGTSVSQDIYIIEEEGLSFDTYNNTNSNIGSLKVYEDKVYSYVTDGTNSSSIEVTPTDVRITGSGAEAAVFETTNLTITRFFGFDDDNGTLALKEKTIPITGTQVGNPLNGDIEVTGDNNTYRIFKHNISEDVEMSFAIEDNFISMSAIGILSPGQAKISMFPNNVQLNVGSGGGTTFEWQPLDGFSSSVDHSNDVTDLNYVQKIYVDALKPYKVYTALLNQSGIGNPTATVLENTLGGTLVWARSGSGEYTATLVGAFVANQTVIFSGSVYEDQVTPGLITSSSVTTDTVVVATVSQALLNSDNLLTNTSIEIRVYN